MTLVIPDSVLEAAGLTAEELLREVAIMLYAQERLTEAQAARLAHMDRWSFGELLAARGIPMHYGVEDLRQDAEAMRRHGELL